MEFTFSNMSECKASGIYFFNQPLKVKPQLSSSFSQCAKKQTPSKSRRLHCINFLIRICHRTHLLIQFSVIILRRVSLKGCTPHFSINSGLQKKNYHKLRRQRYSQKSLLRVKILLFGRNVLFDAIFFEILKPIKIANWYSFMQL